MKVTLIGSRYFGAAVLERLRSDGVEIVRVVAPAEDDRLALAARAAGLPLSLHPPGHVRGEQLHEDCDLVVAAHTHARVEDDALARARLGGIGYHPSLLPRHRGIAAVEWTLLEGDPITGGSIYHLAHGWDAGALAAQDWCFVVKGESARDLWERALAPMGLRLIGEVVQHAARHGSVPSHVQDERFATRAPKIRRALSLAAEPVEGRTSLVVTVIGPDKAGLVRLLSDRAQAHGANWAASRMASLAGQFAGIVHLDVPTAAADTLTAALRELEPLGLKMSIERSDAPHPPPGRRLVHFELSGPDRPGIVRLLSTHLAERGVGIEDLHTEIVGAADGHVFRMRARLVVPQALADAELRRLLETLEAEMMVDIALDDGAAPRK